jgi:hypothetical protein
MSRHLRKWLNDAALVALGGEYEGVIASVSEERIRNRFTAQTQLEPVIAFEDGFRLVPNLTMRRALAEALGDETDHWIGQRVRVWRRTTETVNRTTGEVRRVQVKTVELLDAPARVVPHPRAASAAPPADAIFGDDAVADYDDDSDEALAFPAERRRRG